MKRWTERASLPKMHLMIVRFVLLLAFGEQVRANASCGCDRQYWYRYVPPSSLQCDPLGVSIILQCTVFLPPDAPNATVKWYRSETRQYDPTATAISDGTPAGYTVTTPPPSEISSNTNPCFNGLLLFATNLAVSNFTVSNEGYYWCQIDDSSTNDFLNFQPSQHSYIATNPQLSKCEISSQSRFTALNPAECAVSLFPVSTSLSQLFSVTVSLPSALLPSPVDPKTTSVSPILSPSNGASRTASYVYIASGLGCGVVFIIICAVTIIGTIMCVQLQTSRKKDTGKNANHSNRREEHSINNRDQVDSHSVENEAHYISAAEIIQRKLKTAAEKSANRSLETAADPGYKNISGNIHPTDSSSEYAVTNIRNIQNSESADYANNVLAMSPHYQNPTLTVSTNSDYCNIDKEPHHYQHLTLTVPTSSDYCNIDEESHHYQHPTFTAPTSPDYCNIDKKPHQYQPLTTNSQGYNKEPHHYQPLTTNF